MSEATPTEHGSTDETATNVTHDTPEAADVDIQPFLLDDPPAAVGGSLQDTAVVKDCLDAAVEYFHDQLPEYVRQRITETWGITAATIGDKRIGYTGSDDGVVAHLREQGFSGLTIARTGLVGNGGLRHVFECKPSNDRRPLAFNCPHDFSPELDALSIKRYNNEIDPAAIDLEAVLDDAFASGDRLRNWWDNRIVFPYNNEEGETTYFIGRATDETDDIGYNDGTTAKYLKQTVNKPWVNTDAVNEPMFGCETVTSGESLLITEGVTDAIMAHQFDFNCITPATTEFKHQHHKQLREYAEQATAVYIINDNDRSNVGLQKALTTAATLFDTAVDVYVGLLPRAPRQENIDLADYLAVHGPDALSQLLNHAIQPFDQDELLIKANRKGQSSKGNTTQDNQKQSSDTDNNDKTPTNQPKKAGNHSRRTVASDGRASAIYDLTLDNVIDYQSVGINRSSANTSLYRGDNPINHTGEDHSGYFAIYQESVTNPETGDTSTELRARDFKTDYSYNALTWMACASEVRSTDTPQGALSDKEIWNVWKYAKTQDHISIPTDDPIPLRAIWYLARKHDLAPESFIPVSFDDSVRLPPTIYNRVLETVVREYGVNHGRTEK